MHVIGRPGLLIDAYERAAVEILPLSGMGDALVAGGCDPRCHHRTET